MQSEEARIEGRLKATAARIRRARAASLAFWIIALITGFLLAMSLFDSNAPLAVTPRAVALGMLAPCLALLVWRALILPKVDAAQLAREAARRFPERGHDVLSALELRAAGAEPAARRHVAPGLVAAALERLEERARSVPVEALLDRSRSRRALCAAALGVLGLALFWASTPARGKVSLSRVLMLADASYPQRTRIVSLVPGDARLVRAEEAVRLTIEAEGDLPPSGLLHVRTRAGIELQSPLEDLGAGRFSALLPHLDESYAYTVELGDARSPTHAVEIVPLPTVHIALHIEPPPGFVIDDALLGEEGDAIVPEGSLVTITARADKPLAAVRLDTEAALGEVQFELDGGRVAIWGPHEVWEGFQYRLELEDTDGLNPARSPRYRLSVAPDRRPDVELRTELGVLTLLQESSIRLPFRAGDDGSLAALRLHVEPFSTDDEEGGPAPEGFDFELELPVAEGDVLQEFEGVAEVELSAIGAGVGSRWQCWIEAEDSRRRAPNLASSPPVTVRVVEPETFFETLRRSLVEIARHRVQRFLSEQRQLAGELDVLIASDPLDTPRRVHVLERQREAGRRIGVFVAEELEGLRAWLRDNRVIELPESAAFHHTEDELSVVAALSEDEIVPALEGARLSLAKDGQVEAIARLLALVQGADPAIIVTELGRSLETVLRMQRETTRTTGDKLRALVEPSPLRVPSTTAAFETIRSGHDRVLTRYQAFLTEMQASLDAGGADEAVGRCLLVGLDMRVLSELGGISTLLEIASGAERSEDERIAALHAVHASLRGVLRGLAFQLIELAPSSTLAMNVLTELSSDPYPPAGSRGESSELGLAGAEGGAPQDVELPPMSADAGPKEPRVAAADAPPVGDAPDLGEPGPTVDRQKKSEAPKEPDRRKFEEFDPVHARDLAKLPGQATDRQVRAESQVEQLEGSLNEQAQLERRMASMEQSGDNANRQGIEEQLREQEEELRRNLEGQEAGENARNALQNAKDARKAFKEGKDEEAREHQRQTIEYTLAAYTDEVSERRKERDPNSEGGMPVGLEPEQGRVGGAADDESGRTGGGLLVEVGAAPANEEEGSRPEAPTGDELSPSGRIWLFELPPSLEEQLRLEKEAAPPPGYERRMQSYFRSLD